MQSNHVLTDRSDLSVIRKQVRAELTRADVDPSAAFDCLVALTEACTQALVHTDEEHGEEHPRISWEIDRAEALFFIRDYTSREWSRASHPSRTAAERETELEQRLESLGLQLMRGLMDDVRIEIGSAGTTVVLVKTLT